MMITTDDPRVPERPGLPLPAVPSPVPGDRIVRLQLTCQRGRWRLSQLGPASRFCLVCAVVRVSSSRRCSTRVFAFSGFMVTAPRACLRLLVTIYLEYSLVEIYLEIWVRMGVSTLFG